MESKYPHIPIDPSEITPKHVYYNRREFLKAAGIVTGAAVLVACTTKPGTPSPTDTLIPQVTPPGLTVSTDHDELGGTINTYQQITHYNNYYEFTVDKAGVANLAQNFKTSPWSVEVSGLVQNPKTYSVDELIQKFSPEERIYRLRCVEAWSMVIPWQGFPLHKLLDEVQPTSEAKYIKFTGVLDKADMPGQSDQFLYWPYTEGLRMDEARKDLVILATGLYGVPLLPQDGAPIRLVVPWKYGFKSIKAITKIEFVTDQPTTEWPSVAPDEYGFYANVNPNVPHPRWSQATELRIGINQRIPTLMFNGYGDEVSDLYTGMDLTVNF